MYRAFSYRNFYFIRLRYLTQEYLLAGKWDEANGGCLKLNP